MAVNQHSPYDQMTVQRRKRNSWVVVLVLQAALFLPAVVSAGTAGTSFAQNSAEPCPGCPDCPDSGCLDSSCPAPCGAIAVPMVALDIALFLTAEKTLQPIVTFAKAPADAPLHPPPIP